MTSIHEQLDAVIAQLKKLNTRDDDMWTKEDIGNWLTMKPSSINKLIKHKDFPKAIKAPTSDNGSHPRWVAGEVKRFILKYRDSN